MKIGILGGSFDPIHNGHINMAVSAYKEFNLDEIWIIPAGHSPNKEENTMTNASHRFEMCELATASYNYMKVSDIEIQKDNTSYTYLTLQELRKLYPQHDLYFIMGADSLDYFEKWFHPEIIASLCTILVIVRDGFDKDAMVNKINAISELFPCNIQLVKSDRYDISSTDIRSFFASDRKGNSEAITQHICPEVYEYIIENKLYSKE